MTNAQLHEEARSQARPELVAYAHNWRYQAVGTLSCHDLLRDEYCGSVDLFERYVHETSVQLHGTEEEVRAKIARQVASHVERWA